MGSVERAHGPPAKLIRRRRRVRARALASNVRETLRSTRGHRAFVGGGDALPAGRPCRFRGAGSRPRTPGLTCDRGGALTGDGRIQSASLIATLLLGATLASALQRPSPYRCRAKNGEGLRGFSNAPDHPRSNEPLSAFRRLYGKTWFSSTELPPQQQILVRHTRGRHKHRIGPI